MAARVSRIRVASSMVRAIGTFRDAGVSDTGITMKRSFFLAFWCVALITGGCAPSGGPPGMKVYSGARAEEETSRLMAQAAAAHAALRGGQNEQARLEYNRTVAELVYVLRSRDKGSHWNKPQTIAAGGKNYQLRFVKGDGKSRWDPDEFTDLVPAEKVAHKILYRRNILDGVGGALVGVRQKDPQEPFTFKAGVTAPVTALLDFQGSNATLELLDPSEQRMGELAGSREPLEADISAPLAYYPVSSELWYGLAGAIRVGEHMKAMGLYMLQPYDPDRIPLIFVHGLLSTPRMWRNVVNELEADPELRGRYQCWVFGYPTGNPPAYSAMRFRDELDKARKLYPTAKDSVIVGHSMGGLLTRMQVSTVTRETWNDVIGKKKVDRLLDGTHRGDIVERSMIFNANPHVGRVVFICTPHRGSEMALGRLGQWGSRLIFLPVDLVTAVPRSFGAEFAIVSDTPGAMPNSVTGLSPKNPTLRVLDTVPIEVPYHTILGDRGKGDSPKSSDGIVEYWSSSLKKAESEKIVPGPHSACELPETLTELKRILRLHANKNPN